MGAKLNYILMEADDKGRPCSGEFFDAKAESVEKAIERAIGVGYIDTDNSTNWVVVLESALPVFSVSYRALQVEAFTPPAPKTNRAPTVRKR